MNSQRKSYNADFKAKVALEAIRGHKTINEIASQSGIHPNQITQWKKLVLQSLPSLFSDKRDRANKDDQILKDQLFQQIGQLKFELDWLKKKVGLLDRS